MSRLSAPHVGWLLTRLWLLTAFLWNASPIAAADPAPLQALASDGGGQLLIITDRARHSVQVEVAASRAERERGLMDRTELEEAAGMLFLYEQEQPAETGFWMYRTRIPLDIAYLDARGTILAIAHMEPCRRTASTGCPTYPAGVPYSAALEVNSGYFAARGIAPGHRVRWASEAAARRP